MNREERLSAARRLRDLPSLDAAKARAAAGDVRASRWDNGPRFILIAAIAIMALLALAPTGREAIQSGPASMALHFGTAIPGAIGLAVILYGLVWAVRRRARILASARHAARRLARRAMRRPTKE